MARGRVASGCAAVAVASELCGCSGPVGRWVGIAGSRWPSNVAPGASAGGYVVLVGLDTTGNVCKTLVPRTVVTSNHSEFTLGCSSGFGNELTAVHDRTRSGSDILWGIAPPDAKFVRLTSGATVIAPAVVSHAKTLNSYLAIIPSLPTTFEITATDASGRVVGEVPNTAIPPVVPCLPSVRAEHPLAGQASAGLCQYDS